MASIAHMAGESGTGFAGSLETNGLRPTTPKTLDTTSVDSVRHLTRRGWLCLGILHDSCTESTIVFAMELPAMDLPSVAGSLTAGLCAAGRATATFADLRRRPVAPVLDLGRRYPGLADFRDLVGCEGFADFLGLARTSISTAETIPGFCDCRFRLADMRFQIGNRIRFYDGAFPEQAVPMVPAQTVPALTY